MIDFITCLRLPVGVDELLCHPMLSFPMFVDNLTGEVREQDKTSSNYKNLTFIVNRKYNTIRLKGSLHKFWNEGRHNFNDFNFYAMRGVVNTLWEQFGIDPFATPINHVEFGVNLSMPNMVKLILGSLVSHKGEPFTWMNIMGCDGRLCRHGQFEIKVYNKSKQYEKLGCPADIIRIEIKVTRMEYLRKRGIPIRTLSDLVNKDVLHALGELLVKVVGEILYFDPTINLDSLSRVEGDIISRVTNPIFWDKNKPLRTRYGSSVDHDVQLTRYKFNNMITHYRKLMKKYAEVPIQYRLEKEINRKWESLVICQAPFTLVEVLHPHKDNMPALDLFP